MPTPQKSDRQQLPLTTRAAVVPASINEEARTVDVTWTTGAEVQRYDWRSDSVYVERLSLDPKHVRLGRLQAGAPVLDTHSSYRAGHVLGVVESASMERGAGVARIRFSDREDVAPIWRDVSTGILRSISVGYAVHEWRIQKREGQPEIRTAVDWEPFELSLVPIPADVGAQTRSYEDSEARVPGERTADMPDEIKPAPNGAPPQQSQAEQERAAPQPPPTPQPQPAGDPAQAAVAAERARVSDIHTLCRQFAVDPATYIAEGTSVDAVRAAVLSQLAARQNAAPTDISVGGERRDADMRRDMTNALLSRAGRKVEGEGHRNYGDGNLLRLAEDILSAGGVNVRTLSRHEIATRAVSTSDFSSILALTAQTILRAAYDEAPMAHRIVFRRTTNSDFKTKQLISVAAGSTLPELEEGGQIAQRAPVAAYTGYALKTYAGIVTMTRQMIVNDDFGLFARTAQQRGRAAAETERKVVWDLIKSNPGSFFHTDNGNTTSAGAGSTVTLPLLAGARQAMRDQTDLDGTPSNILLRSVVAGSATELDWEQLLSPLYVPTAAGTVVPGTLRNTQLVIEPAITDDSWYGFADPAQVDTIEYAYLAGAEGVQLDQRVGFSTDGMELRALLDFGVGMIEPKGCYRVAQS